MDPANEAADIKCCVIIPAYHEAGHIGPVVQDALRFCPWVLVVDDGSSDTTAQEARDAGADVIVHTANQGKGVALQTGLDKALEGKCDVAITMDADGQHDPQELPVFLEAYGRTRCPVLTGNRMSDNENMPLVRKLTNRFMSWLLSREMKQRVPDTQCGYRLYAAEVIPLLRAESSGFAAESEQLLYLADQGIEIGSVPVKTIYGDEESKIHPVSDTLKFFSMLRQYRRGKRSGAT
jgi:glycosyltransferase involved in cell wall biosynthesis